MRQALKAIGVIIALALAGFAAAGALSDDGAATRPTTSTNGHTPVTICHKPGTPAEQELVVDDDSVELTGHLGHGDTIGPCSSSTTTTTTTSDPCDSPAADQYEECNPPPTTTVTTTTGETTTTSTPPPGDCPPGMVHERGHDGNEGNDDCCFPGVNCDGDVSPPGDTTTTAETTATTPTTPAPTTGQETEPPVVSDPGDTTTTPSKPKPAKPGKVKTSSSTSTKHQRPPACPPGKPFAGKCGVQGSG